MNCQWIANGQSCMVRVHTKPESQMMTPDTRHTQVSVQITTKTPFQLLVSQQLFCSTSTIQWYSLQNDFSICICTPTRFKGGARLHQQSQPPCQSTTPASCSYSPLVSFPACCFCVSQLTTVFAFDLVTLETVLCFVSALSTEVATELELCHC